MTYLTEAAKFSRRVQWLIEIDLDRCSLDYTTSPCTASDQGDGMRCFYSFTTCQDPANYTRTTRTWRFCLRDVPWTDTANPAFPYLEEFTSVSQEIDPAKLATFPEQIKIRMIPDWTVPSFDRDKALFNTGSVGEFWRNLIARNRNYVGRPVRVMRGFYGLPLSEFYQIGPAYRLHSIEVESGRVTITAESPLAELNRKKLPWEISEDNITTLGDGVATAINVVDASEYPDPVDYGRFSIYVQIENEIIKITSRDTGANQLVGVRGSLNTTAVAHTAKKVKHVAFFGTDNGISTPPTGRNPVEVLRDLMAWAGIADGDIDTASFDTVRDYYTIEDSILKTVSTSREIAKHAQFIREAYGIMVYMNDEGKWACRILAPQTGGDLLTEDNLLWQSVSVDEDEDSRVTRVAYYYDPIEENPGDDTSQYSKSVIVIGADLEQANNYGDKKERSFFDAWLDPALSIASIRNLARRVLTRFRNGLRTVGFDLDLVDASSVNVGVEKLIQTRHIQDARGMQEARPCVVTSKREPQRGRVSYNAVDVNYAGRFMRIAPDTVSDSYDTASAEDRSYGYWGDADNRVGSAKEHGYIFW